MLVFFGTSRYSAQFLELAQKRGLKIDLVVSALPKPIGRKKVLTENPTVVAAKKQGLPFLTSAADLLAYKTANQVTVGLMLDYNQIIRPAIIDLFPKGIINIHFSRLPQYRGPAPVQYTILNNEPQAWISYFLITAGLDKGPLLAQTSLSLKGNETTESLYQKLVEKAATEIGQITKNYLSGKIIPQPQKGKPSYTEKLTVEKTKIDWSWDPKEIERLIRAAYPEPGAWTETEVRTKNNKPKIKRLKVLKAHLENNALILAQVQLEGKNPVTYKQFKEGYPKAEVLGASCSFLSFL